MGCCTVVDKNKNENPLETCHQPPKASGCPKYNILMTALKHVHDFQTLGRKKKSPNKRKVGNAQSQYPSYISNPTSGKSTCFLLKNAF